MHLLYKKISFEDAITRCWAKCKIYVPVVPARGGAEVALDLIRRPFSPIELASNVRQPGPCVNACFARTCCTVLLHGCCPRTSKNMTGARPHGNASPSKHFLHTSHCTLHTAHFMLHTCTSHSTRHLISKNLVSPRLMSPHLISSHPLSSN